MAEEELLAVVGLSPAHRWSLRIAVAMPVLRLVEPRTSYTREEQGIKNNSI
jgi:hypothetical protein